MNWGVLLIITRAVCAFRSRLVRFSNIVCTSRFRLKPGVRTIPLEKLARITLNSKFSSTGIPAVQYRFGKSTATTMSLYHTGSIIHCGGHYICEKMRSVRHALDYFAEKIDVVDETYKPVIKIINTVTPVKMPFRVDLDKLLANNPLTAVYIREVFPGCALTLSEEEGRSNVKAVVFNPGSVNLLGCESAAEAIKYRLYLRQFLADYKFYD